VGSERSYLRGMLRVCGAVNRRGMAGTETGLWWHCGVPRQCSPFHTVLDGQSYSGGGMKREHRQLTRTGWEHITSRRLVVRRLRPLERPHNTPLRAGLAPPGPLEPGSRLRGFCLAWAFYKAPLIFEEASSMGSKPDEHSGTWPLTVSPVLRVIGRQPGATPKSRIFQPYHRAPAKL
jgi:hypothetical protein